MIDSFFDQISKDIFDGKNTKNTQKRLPSYLHKIAQRKLDMINAAATLEDLKVPPSNKLEKLHGNRKYQHSIRINDQYCIVFTWVNGNVEVVDYH